MVNLVDLNIPRFVPNIGGGLGDTIEHPLQRQIGIPEEGRTAFQQFLDAAMDVVEQTNHRLIESDVAQVRFATGEDNDMLTVILAQDRANSALNFTVNVSNRIIEAYREIMRMQV